MSLHEFIATNHDELIRRTRAKVAQRSVSQPSSVAELEHGVPVLLSQLVKALDVQSKIDAERERTGEARADAGGPDTNEDIGRSAGVHGQDLRKFGFTIGQVVHGYGDVCQAVTELALERNAHVTTSEFHTLNSCLDNAIAGAVTSWSQPLGGPGEYKSNDAFAQRLSVVIENASVSFEALRSGRVGVGGATGIVLATCLSRLRSIVEDMKRN
jgi:hypothetical protein